MRKRYLLALDQGTTGTRAFLYDHTGAIVAQAYRALPQYYPAPAWVEHDPEEIWTTCRKTIHEVLQKSRVPKMQIVALGLTNQRETTLLWDRQTSKPLARAIVWQCRRSNALCQELKQSHLEPLIRSKTGLCLDPYFSATKIQWLLRQSVSVRNRAIAGKLCFGTVDSWLIWKLTGGRLHATDMTNASRTMLFNIRQLLWDEELLKILDIPAPLLPHVRNSGSDFGTVSKKAIPELEGVAIAAVLGDQQAALFGQNCFDPGSIKNTYGTGCFVVLNTGKRLIIPPKGLIATIASDSHGKPLYALEGSIFIAGALMQWLRDNLNFLEAAPESEKMIKGAKDTLGVYIVPAFVGLGSPYWDAQASGLITGLTRGTQKKHIVRAALEAIAYQTRDVIEVFSHYHIRLRELQVDGGACQNNFLMQFQADILNCVIKRPKNIDTTVQGAAFLAGMTIGLWKTKQDLLKLKKIDRTFYPRMSAAERTNRYKGWLSAIRRSRYQC